MAHDCIFCKMVAGQIPVTKLYEDDFVLCFLDIGPLSDGHSLVVAKRHFENLHDCPPEILAKISSAAGKLGKALVDAVGYEGYNILCNNGRAAGQLVKHVHFHIIGRRTGDGLFHGWPAFKYGEGQGQRIADLIRQKL